MYSIKKAKDAVKDGIKAYLYKDDSGNYVMDEYNRMPFYLEGSPGIGKTGIVSEIAEEMDMGFVSFSITHHSRNTVLGLPVISESEGIKYTEYTMSEIIARVCEEYNFGKKEGILLLDEFNCMSDTLMPVMLSFLQTKNIGMHRLPEGWVIVLCGNPPQYNKSARTFGFSVLDRLRKIDVEYSAEDFILYAEETGFDPVLLNYLKLHKDSACVCGQGKEEELATPRAWENLSIALGIYENTGGTVDEAMIRQFIKCDRIAREFARFYELENKNKLKAADMEKILEGRDIDAYCARLNGMSLDVRFDVVDNLMNMIKIKYGKKGTGPKKISEYINNVLALFLKLGDDPAIEKAFSHINKDGKLLGILAKYKSDMFLQICDKIYYNLTPVLQ